MTAVSKKDEHQTQFLNSTSPTSEYEEEEKKQQQPQQPQPELKADFNENEKVATSENKAPNQTKPKTSPDTVDCSSTKVAHGRSALTTIPSKPNKILHVVTPTIQKHSKVGGQTFRYTLDELKLLAKTPASIKAPEVSYQKGDCVAQLFVLQQNKHNNAQAGGGSHMPQSYQQMSFYENMEFIGGKNRRNQQRKQHDNQSITSSCGNIAGVGGAAGGSSVGMTGGSVSVTGTSFARPVRMIRVNLSLNEEIKLSESENAWQPTTLTKMKDPSAGTDTIEATVKKVRGVLNKLTPENFNVLLKTMTSISLDSSDKMQNVNMPLPNFFVCLYIHNNNNLFRVD